MICSPLAEFNWCAQLATRRRHYVHLNNTSPKEFEEALVGEGGCIGELDDINLIDKVPKFPELVCFRYNPGPARSGNVIIGTPEEAKYGVAHSQLIEAFRRAKARGAKRFGLYTMLASNGARLQLA